MTSSSDLRVRVVRKQVEAQDICSFELAAVTGALPGFAAGSHIDVQVAAGLVRQYSLCNKPAERDRYLIGVLREPASRGGSVAMHDNVREGDVLTISAPKNHFALAADAQNSLLLAGGIGVTPILCMAERLAHSDAAFTMHYCTRTRARAAFCERIESSPFAAAVQFHFDDGAPEQKMDIAALLKAPQAGTHLYVCGPKGFMDAVLSTARAQGWSEAQIHFEYFAAEVLKSDSDGEFEVVIASSGKVVRVGKAQTVVQALAAAGVEIPTSCEQGVCGTCLTRLLEGEPDHKDMFLTSEEQALNNQFLPCCSRAKSARLVIDL